MTYNGSSVVSLVIEKKTVRMTAIRMAATSRMVNTKESQPGMPRRARRLGIGSTVIVITIASRIGLMMVAASRTPNRIKNMLAIPTR